MRGVSGCSFHFLPLEWCGTVGPEVRSQATTGPIARCISPIVAEGDKGEVAHSECRG